VRTLRTRAAVFGLWASAIASLLPLAQWLEPTVRSSRWPPRLQPVPLLHHVTGRDRRRWFVSAATGRRSTFAPGPRRCLRRPCEDESPCWTAPDDSSPSSDSTMASMRSHRTSAQATTAWSPTRTQKGDGHLDEGTFALSTAVAKDRPEGDGDRQVERFNFASVRLPDTRSTATSVAYARAANTITRGDAGQLSNEFTPVCSPSRGSEPSSRRLTRPPSGMPGHPLGSSRVAPPRTRQAAGERSWTCALLATAR
jgi:hypothetical protein